MIDILIRIIYAIDGVENRVNRWVMRRIGVVQTVIVVALLLTLLAMLVVAGALK